MPRAGCLLPHHQKSDEWQPSAQKLCRKVDVARVKLDLIFLRATKVFDSVFGVGGVATDHNNVMGKDEKHECCIFYLISLTTEGKICCKFSLVHFRLQNLSEASCLSRFKHASIKWSQTSVLKNKTYSCSAEFSIQKESGDYSTKYK